VESDRVWKAPGHRPAHLPGPSHTRWKSLRDFHSYTQPRRRRSPPQIGEGHDKLPTCGRWPKRPPRSTMSPDRRYAPTGWPPSIGMGGRIRRNAQIAIVRFAVEMSDEVEGGIIRWSLSEEHSAEEQPCRKGQRFVHRVPPVIEGFAVSLWATARCRTSPGVTGLAHSVVLALGGRDIPFPSCSPVPRLRPGAPALAGVKATPGCQEAKAVGASGACGAPACGERGGSGDQRLAIGVLAA
jgi:hypothetical protein